MTSTSELDREGLGRYALSVGERWPLQRALLGGAKAADERGAPADGDRGAEYVVVLVTDAFADVPWLERVHQAATLWDAAGMTERAEMHCYTEIELKRRLGYLPQLQDAVEQGIDLLA